MNMVCFRVLNRIGRCMYSSYRLMIVYHILKTYTNVCDNMCFLQDIHKEVEDKLRRFHKRDETWDAALLSSGQNTLDLIYYLD